MKKAIETLHADVLATATGGTWVDQPAGPPSPNSSAFVSEQGGLYCTAPHGKGFKTKDWRCNGSEAPLPRSLVRPPHVWAQPVPAPDSPLWAEWSAHP